MTITYNQPVGPSYAMSVQHKSNIGSASFIWVIVDWLLCKTKITAVHSDGNNHSLFNAGTSSQIVD